MKPTCRVTAAMVAATAALAATLTVCGAEQGASPFAVPASALEMIRRLPIQYNGRHKPFDSFAREVLNAITGHPRVGRQDPVVTVLSMIAQPEVWQPQAIIAIPFVPLRESLGMDRKAQAISYDDLVATRVLMRHLPPIVAKQQREEKLTMLEQETMDAFERFVGFSNLIQHRLELVPSSSASSPVWQSIMEPEGYAPEVQARVRGAWNDWIGALRDQQPEAIRSTTTALVATLRNLSPSAVPADWKIGLEVFYNHAAPFTIAHWLYLLAAIMIGMGLSPRRAQVGSWGMRVMWLTALLHAGGILIRVAVGGRPPVSNFFETMLWLPFVAVVLALIFERIYRAGYFAFSASILAAITLWVSEYVPLDSSISPVVAVLRSNLWLTIHVLTIVASYGALALAAVLAHIYGVQFAARSARRGSHRSLASLEALLYRVIQVGVVLLAGGIMLGAVWANASWGRYWGWDPKETWALITLLWFIATLHGRFAGWLQGVAFALTTISGFFLLLMTYYGVSFYLVGLHSYAGGHAKPLPPLLIGYVAAELAFLAWVGWVAARQAVDK